MTQFIRLVAAILALMISLPASADILDNPPDYAYVTLKGLNTIAVKIDPPRGSEYTMMSMDGVSSEQLQDYISARLRNAGFKVITFTESLTDPEAVLLDLRVRVDTPRNSFYVYDLQLSVNQKLPLSQDNNSFYSVRTWSDRQVGSLQRSGPGLYPFYDYSMQLLDNFIKAHQAQN
ncbi:MAG: hypothetical protein ACRESK_01205 [Gammaproteobacteria bacterium]